MNDFTMDDIPPHSPIIYKTPEEDHSVGKRIWELYKAGAPLFTKQLLVDAEEQLTRTSGEMVLTGVDGNKCYVTGGGVIRNTCHDPYAVSFKSIQRLIRGTSMDRHRQPSTAFCSLEVYSYKRRPTSPGDFDVIRQRFDEYERAWLASSACGSLMATLSSAPIPGQVTKIVCFGLGDLHADDYPLRSREYSQHAAALTMAETLKQLNGRDVSCYAQDPEYTPASRQYLQDRGFTIMDGAKGFIEVDGTTLVFSVAPNVPVKQIVTELARPAVIVWDACPKDMKGRTRVELADWFVEERELLSLHCTDPDSPRTRDMLRDEYVTYHFAEDSDIFGVLEIHVKKE